MVLPENAGLPETLPVPASDAGVASDHVVIKVKTKV